MAKDMVPKRIFLTKGVGKHKERLTSFELALRDAGIAAQNLVRVSSIFPPHCKLIPRKEGLTFPLLADENGVAVRRYGIGLKGLGLRRSVFVIDARGIVRWKHVSLVGARFQSAAVLQEALAGVLA